MKEFLTILSIFLVIHITVDAKTDEHQVFHSPLELPLFLSGNYGELRSGHFHAGIDMKTQSVIGKRVVAAHDGYISRIKIQSGGYGRSLYMTHPNGYTTLYAHLDRFNPEIEKYVQHNQYLRKSYEVELFPGKDMFVLKQGDLIAFSGNTGRSGGPHLHFEIRKTAGQVPVNGLKYNFPIDDSIPPQFRTLYVYTDSARTEHEVKRLNDSVYAVADTLKVQQNRIEFAAEVYDFLNGSGNKCGVYTLQLVVDSKKLFGFKIDQIPFSKTRYINAHMDYELKKFKGKSVHRLYKLPHNDLSIYNSGLMSESIFLVPDSVYSATVEAADVYGNISKLNFSFIAIAHNNNLVGLELPKSTCGWKTGGEYIHDVISVKIPPKALYRDINFSLDVVGDTFKIHSSNEPLHKHYYIQVKPASVEKDIADKLVMVLKNGNGKVSPIETVYEDGVVKSSTSEFGDYFILYDTVPPVITPVKFANKKYVKGDTISFKITDDISGVNKYNVYINNEWALFGYDAKSDMLNYTFNGTIPSGDKPHSIHVVVEDYKGNITNFSNTFIY